MVVRRIPNPACHSTAGFQLRASTGSDSERGVKISHTGARRVPGAARPTRVCSCLRQQHSQQAANGTTIPTAQPGVSSRSHFEKSRSVSGSRMAADYFQRAGIWRESQVLLA